MNNSMKGLKKWEEEGNEYSENVERGCTGSI